MRRFNRPRRRLCGGIFAVAFAVGLLTAFCLPSFCIIMILVIALLLLGITCYKY